MVQPGPKTPESEVLGNHNEAWIATLRVVEIRVQIHAFLQTCQEIRVELPIPTKIRASQPPVTLFPFAGIG
jgi:hypothetical protein